MQKRYEKQGLPVLHVLAAIHLSTGYVVAMQVKTTETPYHTLSSCSNCRHLVHLLLLLLLVSQLLRAVLIFPDGNFSCCAVLHCSLLLFRLLLAGRCCC